jgi:hypothetical protein
MDAEVGRVTGEYYEPVYNKGKRFVRTFEYFHPKY